MSSAALGFLATQVDLAEVLRAFTPEVAAVLVPAVLIYAAVSLLLEALSLRCLLPATGAPLDLWTAARIKCASYLLGIVHYALGVGALTVLLARRAALSIPSAAGVALGISVSDLIVLLAITFVAAGALSAEAPGLRASVVVVGVGGFAGGLWLLRTPRSLGLLDRLRDLEVFRPLRVVAGPTLARLLGLRTAFVLTYFAVVAVAMFAFEIRPPLAELVVGIALVTLVTAVPIAVAGLGTSQAAFLYVFRGAADAERLLACSLLVTLCFVVVRTAMGLVFAREYAREASEAARGEAA